MNKVYLQLGSNIGKRYDYLSNGKKLISDKIGKIRCQSKIYESTPWGVTGQNQFLNQIIIVDTHLNAKKILEISQEIEKESGRKTKNKWEARTLDIDILFFNNEIINTETLKIPHPLIQERLFVLIPLYEINKNLKHPVLKKDISTLLSECNDKEKVNEFAI